LYGETPNMHKPAPAPAKRCPAQRENLPCSLALRPPVRCKRSTIQEPGTSRRRRSGKQTSNSKSCPEGTVQLPTFFNDRGVGDRVDVSTHGKAWKLCRPYRAECFISGLIPGAAPDGLPQAIELSCAFSADLVSRRLTGNAGILAQIGRAHV